VYSRSDAGSLRPSVVLDLAWVDYDSLITTGMK